MAELLLSPNEARVIASLVEKSITTPQYYPMTQNAIMLAANQKSSRFPLMNLSEGEVGNALGHLEELKLVVRDNFSARAQKWRHQFLHQLLLKPQTQAVLVTLMLRGPQTLAELRAHAAPLGGPGDDESVRAVLNDLADRAQPMVTQLPRAPGQSAVRYAHLLCGGESIAVPQDWEAEPAAAPRSAPLEARLAALEQQVSAQQEQINQLKQQLELLIGPPG